MELEKRYNEPKKELLFMQHHKEIFHPFLPLYATMYIRPMYQLISDFEGLIEFVHLFLEVHSETDNLAQKESIEAVVFPLYEQLTERNYNTNLIAL